MISFSSPAYPIKVCYAATLILQPFCLWTNITTRVIVTCKRYVLGIGIQEAIRNLLLSCTCNENSQRYCAVFLASTLNLRVWSHQWVGVRSLVGSPSREGFIPRKYDLYTVHQILLLAARAIYLACLHSQPDI